MAEVGLVVLILLEGLLCALLLVCVFLEEGLGLKLEGRTVWVMGCALEILRVSLGSYGGQGNGPSEARRMISSFSSFASLRTFANDATVSAESSTFPLRPKPFRPKPFRPKPFRWLKSTPESIPEAPQFSVSESSWKTKGYRSRRVRFPGRGACLPLVRVFFAFLYSRLTFRRFFSNSMARAGSTSCCASALAGSTILWGFGLTFRGTRRTFIDCERATCDSRDIAWDRRRCLGRGERLNGFPGAVEPFPKGIARQTVCEG
eukprot:129784-Amorphochlora_amoeboformis.AAC.1